MTRLLRINRPARVRRGAEGRWEWTCWLCPPPLHDVASCADGWAAAFDDADAHARVAHMRHVPIPDDDDSEVGGWAA